MLKSRKTTRRPNMQRHADGAMPLREHLRELRTRLIRSLIAIAVGTVVGWLGYRQLFAILRRPFDDVVAQTHQQNIVLALNGVADPFTLQIQVSAVAGVVLASPIWLYQFWRFVTPGLHRHERRWALGFVAAALPLMAFGAWLSYSVMPIGLNMLFGFTPDGVSNIISVDRYLSFFFRMLLVFAVGFLAPLLIIVMNFAGIVRGQTLLSAWRGIVLGTLLFGAVATPTGDPVNLMLLSGPILLLVFGAIGVALLNDRRRRRRGDLVDYDEWDDDEASSVT